MLYSNGFLVKFPCMTIRRILCRCCDFSRARILCAPTTTEKAVFACLAEPFSLTLRDVHTLLPVQCTHYVHNFFQFFSSFGTVMRLCCGGCRCHNDLRGYVLGSFHSYLDRRTQYVRRYTVCHRHLYCVWSSTGVGSWTRPVCAIRRICSGWSTDTQLRPYVYADDT